MSNFQNDYPSSEYEKLCRIGSVILSLYLWMHQVTENLLNTYR